MKKKFGFTLTEILITLGIIGVVAALTTPAYVRNSANAKTGPILAKFVNSVEAACGQMFNTEMVSKLTSIEQHPTSVEAREDFMEQLSKHLIMAKIERQYIARNPDGTTNSTYESVWQMKDGSIILAYVGALTAGITLNVANSGAYQDPYLVLLYDINGFGGNNEAGKEVFGFILDNAGMIIPMGSKIARRIYNFGDLPYRECSHQGSDALNGWGCSGAIYENGWKVPD